MLNVVITNAWHDDNKGDCAIVLSLMEIISSLKKVQFTLVSEFGRNDTRFENGYRHILSEFPSARIIPSPWPIFPVYCKNPIFLKPHIIRKIWNRLNHRNSCKKQRDTIVACLSELVPIGDQKSSPVNKSSFKKDLDLFKKCIRESDLVFSKGGSFIFSEGTIRGSARLSRVLYPLYFAISSKKPVVICSQSIWGLHSDLDKKISMPILSKSTISVRESLSQQYLQELDIKSNMVPDVAFYLSNKKDIPNPFLVYLREEKAIGTRFIGITVRPWLFEDGNKSYTNTLVQIMEKMCSANSHYKFLLIAQTIGPVEFEDDRIVIRQVIDSTPLNLRNKLIVFQEDVSPYVLKEIYGNLELLIGTRLHSLILAFSMGVPGISITYSEHKSKGIMKMLGLEEFVYDISNLHLDSIVENIEFILENRDKLSKQILAAIQSQKVEIYSFLKACMSKSKDKDFMSLTSEELSWKDNLLAKENEKVSFTG